MTKKISCFLVKKTPKKLKNLLKYFLRRDIIKNNKREKATPKRGNKSGRSDSERPPYFNKYYLKKGRKSKWNLE